MGRCSHPKVLRKREDDRDNREYKKWIKQETQISVSQNSNITRKETSLKRS